jgi:PAS domain-containing protein
LDADLALLDQVVTGDIDSYRLFKRYLRPDGSIVHGDLNVTGIRGEDGGLLALLALIVDVSEREESRRVASEARQLLRGVIDSQLDPWVLLEAVRDSGGRIVDFAYRDANEAALAANRLSRDELLTTTLLELLPRHVETGLFDAYARVVETGVPLSLDDDPYASELTDGQTRWFDKPPGQSRRRTELHLARRDRCRDDRRFGRRFNQVATGCPFVGGPGFVATSRRSAGGARSSQQPEGGGACRVRLSLRSQKPSRSGGGRLAGSTQGSPARNIARKRRASTWSEPVHSR